MQSNKYIDSTTSRPTLQLHLADQLISAKTLDPWGQIDPPLWNTGDKY